VALYFRLVLQTGIIYTHFMYVPICLACWWRGRKGMFVAAGLGAVVVGLHLTGLGRDALWNDLARVGAFVLVSFSIGTLRERAWADALALQRSERRYRLLVEKALKGILVCRDRRVLFVNDHLCALVGTPGRKLVGRNLEELVVDEDAERLRELVCPERAETLPDERHELRFLCADGSFRWTNVSSCRTDFEGQEAVLLNVYDISPRKEAEAKRLELAELARRQEEQLEHSTRLAELGEMAAAIAHELNQPLTGIRNYARNAFYMLDQGVGSDAEVKGNLRLIAEQVDRAAKIINEMRELTRRSEMHFARLDINGVIRESVDFLLPQMKLSGVGVQLYLDSDLPEIRGDRIRLAQVFLNLLNNARQAMEESSLRKLSIKSECDGGGQWVSVEVRDTGKGFSEEESAKLFVPFYTTKKSGLGTGLGLSISKNIVKDHGGTIQAAGWPGKGAAFTVLLPAAGQEAELQE
jgi:PAS domain S-box-containing protein